MDENRHELKYRVTGSKEKSLNWFSENPTVSAFLQNDHGVSVISQNLGER
jgi:hypothetical protein